MSDRNDQLYEEARKAIEELFSDMSVSQEKAIENLETLISDMEIKIEGLKADMDADGMVG